MIFPTRGRQSHRHSLRSRSLCLPRQTCYPCVRTLVTHVSGLNTLPAADMGSGTGHIVSPGKQAAFVRSETGRDRIETGATASAACPTKFRRRLHLSNLAGRDTLFHRADPGRICSFAQPAKLDRARRGPASPRGPKLDRPPPASRSAVGGDPFSHKGERIPTSAMRQVPAVTRNSSPAGWGRFYLVGDSEVGAPDWLCLENRVSYAARISVRSRKYIAQPTERRASH